MFNLCTQDGFYNGMSLDFKMNVTCLYNIQRTI